MLLIFVLYTLVYTCIPSQQLAPIFRLNKRFLYRWFLCFPVLCNLNYVSCGQVRWWGWGQCIFRRVDRHSLCSFFWRFKSRWLLFYEVIVHVMPILSSVFWLMYAVQREMAASSRAAILVRVIYHRVVSSPNECLFDTIIFKIIINSWFSAPPTAWTMTHNTVQFNSAIPTQGKSPSGAKVTTQLQKFVW